MIRPEDIRLYPMTQDVMGKRTHKQYVDQMANKIDELYRDYRIDYEDIRKLVDYAEQRMEEDHAH